MALVADYSDSSSEGEQEEEVPKPQIAKEIKATEPKATESTIEDQISDDDDDHVMGGGMGSILDEEENAGPGLSSR